MQLWQDNDHLADYDVGDDDNFDDDDPGGDDKHGCDSAAAIKCKLSNRALFCLSWVQGLQHHIWSSNKNNQAHKLKLKNLIQIEKSDLFFYEDTIFFLNVKEE